MWVARRIRDIESGESGRNVSVFPGDRIGFTNIHSSIVPYAWQSKVIESNVSIRIYRRAIDVAEAIAWRRS